MKINEERKRIRSDFFLSFNIHVLYILCKVSSIFLLTSSIHSLELL